MYEPSYPSYQSLSRHNWQQQHEPRYASFGSQTLTGGILLKTRLRLLGALAALGLVGVLLALVFSLTQGSGSLPTTSLSSAPFLASAQNATPLSTPQSQWQKGVVPHLYQTDEAWASYSYAGGTIGDSGCGPTSLAMVYVALTGKTNHTPQTLCAFSEQNGYVEEGLTAWRLMTDGARQLGIRGEVIPADATVMAREVRAGHPLILSMGPGDFTTTGHFIVVTEVTDSGNFIVNDPNSETLSAQSWNPERLLAQCRNLWAFSC